MQQFFNHYFSVSSVTSLSVTLEKKLSGEAASEGAGVLVVAAAAAAAAATEERGPGPLLEPRLLRRRSPPRPGHARCKERFLDAPLFFLGRAEHQH